MLKRFTRSSNPLRTFAKVLAVYNFPALVERGYQKLKLQKSKKGGGSHAKS